MQSPQEALDGLAAMPCGARLLAALRDEPGAWLVGGAVRDLLLGRTPRELDVVVDGDPVALASRLGQVVASHERFGTAGARDGDCAFDVVRARAESYAAPGALPDVRPGTPEEDLARRDFTVNAIALRPRVAGGGRGAAEGGGAEERGGAASGGAEGRGGAAGGAGAAGEGGGAEHGGAGAGGFALARPSAGVAEVRAAPGALEDLAQRRLRVLHDRSFRDDPTRLWRLVRYAVRLGFLPEAGTDRLAAQAVAAGALTTVSADRLGAELRLALTEADPLGTLHAAQVLGLVAGLDLDPGRVTRALELAPPEARRDLVLLGAVVPDGAWAAGFGFSPAEQHVLDRAARMPPLMPDRPSAVVAALRHEPVEAIAVAGARGDGETALRHLYGWRHVRLAITGEDLLAAGIPQGPELGERLARVLARRLDGELDEGRDAELAAALA